MLRHTHATIYYQETKDIKQVQERLGHAQIQTTMNLYLHPSDEDIRKDWEKHNMHLKSMKKLKVVNMKRKRQINIGEVNFHERLKYELSSYIEKQSNLMDLLPLTVWTILFLMNNNWNIKFLKSIPQFRKMADNYKGNVEMYIFE